MKYSGNRWYSREENEYQYNYMIFSDTINNTNEEGWSLAMFVELLVMKMS